MARDSPAREDSGKAEEPFLVNGIPKTTHVCNLRLGVSKGMLPVQNQLHQNLMNVTTERMAPSTRQPLNGQGVLRITGSSFSANMKPDKRIGVRFGSWNVGSFRGRGTEVCEELRRRKVDVCCVQEVRWRGPWGSLYGFRRELEVQVVVVRK